MRSYPGVPWAASDVTGGPVDELFAALRRKVRRLRIEHLAVPNPNDDDNVWVITRARDGAEIQIDTFPSGRLPFRVEADDEPPVDHQQVAEAVAHVERWLRTGPASREEWLKDCVRRLAMPADVQRAWLESIGTAPSADELALEFDDARQGPLTISAEAEVALARLDRLLDAMSGPSPVWHVDALVDASQWAEVRALAQGALPLLESGIAAKHP
ncbi:hypothetical protein SK803_38975 [Lentzea sp. BCCO 10_0856]|uniref:Uncharacterized protein n=1 Tax=Lentzea miocenica TaxID=3095431 RepID=A0ABU4TDF2_9PSEU|nr:hypothetical protein [Lentzea sp. BCCO 10_0856]MDX8036215.1 hypothetical protein [Lentzea sp. BCCO 10_0856]